jgi:uncharacterized protein
MIVFFLIIGSVVGGHLFWWWWADRRLRRLPHGGWWRGGLALYMGAMLGYIAWMFTSPDAARAAHFHFPTALLGWIYIWYIFAVPLAVVVLGLYHLGRLLRRGANLLKRPMTEPLSADAGDPPGQHALSRRQVLAAAAAAAPIVITGGALTAGMQQIRSFRIRNIELALPALPAELDGLRIAHVSDVHVGRYTRGAILRRIADATNELKADLVFLTGDLLDLSMRDLPEALEMIQRIDRRGGLYMCEGNHDLIDDPIAYRREVRQAGIPLLLNQSEVIEVRGQPLQLLGVKWARGDGARSDEMQYIRRLHDPRLFSILLAHHPHVFDDAAEEGVDLTLAGHTHGGQIMVAGHVGAGRVLFRYLSGHYRKRNSSLIVSNGVGMWFPLQINAPSEIIHLTLHTAAA